MAYNDCELSHHNVSKKLNNHHSSRNKTNSIWRYKYCKRILTIMIKENNAVVVLILLYGCTKWMLTKRMEKKLDSNYTRMLWAILNKYWRQHPTKQQLYGHLPPIMKTIKVRWTRHAGHCWRSKDELISDVLLWTPSHGRPARTYIQQLCTDTGYSLEDHSGVMDDRDGWWERVREIHAGSATWWWWWWSSSCVSKIWSFIKMHMIIKNSTVFHYFFWSSTVNRSVWWKIKQQ